MPQLFSIEEKVPDFCDSPSEDKVVQEMADDDMDDF